MMNDTSMTHKKVSKKATFQWKMACGWYILFIILLYH